MNNRWDWSFINKVAYINLAERRDRDQQIQDVFREIAMPVEKVLRIDAIKHARGKYGCVLSHIKVLEQAIEQQWENVLVVEDDMVFNNQVDDPARWLTFVNHLQAQPQWDVAMLSGNYYIVKTLSPGFLRMKMSYGANCYLVNGHYYPTLLANFHQAREMIEQDYISWKNNLDANWFTLMEQDNWFGIYPCLGYQAAGYSDILGCWRDGKANFDRPFQELKRYGST